MTDVLPIEYPFAVEVVSENRRLALAINRSEKIIVPATDSSSVSLNYALESYSERATSTLRVAHDSRAAAAELLLSASVLNRVAKLIELLDSYLQYNDPRDVEFPFYFDSNLNLVRLQEEALIDCLMLGTSVAAKYVAENQTALDWSSESVSFDVESISLESPLSLRARLAAILVSVAALAPVATVIADLTKTGEGIVSIHETLSKPGDASVFRKDVADRYEKQLMKGDIRVLQQLLLQEGFSPGAINGQMGPDTKRAVNEFVAKYGLPQGTNHRSPVFRLMLSTRAAKRVHCP